MMIKRSLNTVEHEETSGCDDRSEDHDPRDVFSFAHINADPKLFRRENRGVSRVSFAVAVSGRRGDDDSSPGRCFGGWQDSFYSEEVG